MSAKNRPQEDRMMTGAQIAEVLGISTQRVLFLERQALRKMREVLHREGLAEADFIRDSRSGYKLF